MTRADLTEKVTNEMEIAVIDNVGGDHRMAVCTQHAHDRAGTGRRLWQRSFFATGPTDAHPKTCMAAPTPASDGKTVVALFGTNDLVALDLDGNVQWVRSLYEENPGATDGTPLFGPQGAGRSVGITLDRELFIERGDIIAHTGKNPRDTRRLRARIFWLHERPLSKGDQVLVRVGTREARATVVAIEKAVDPGDLASRESASIAKNHVGEIDISLAQPIAADPYSDNQRTGLLVIEVSGRITGGGLVLSVNAGQRADPVDIVPVASALRADERSARYRHNGAVVWLTGLPASGKSTLARALERRLFGKGGSPILLDGDTLRAGLNGDLGFSEKDRSENIRRLAEVATHLARNGHIAIVAAVSPSREDRAAARRIAEAAFR